jgi:hypothetical protein
VVPRDRGERGGFAAGGQRGVAQPPHHECLHLSGWSRSVGEMMLRLLRKTNRE